MATTSQWWNVYAERVSDSATGFLKPMGLMPNAAGIATTEAHLSAPAASAGNLLKMVVRLTVAPGSGKSRRFQVSVNGAASTSLDVTISDTATSGTATATVAIGAGDLVSIKVTPTGTPAVSAAQVSLEFDPTTANAYCYPCSYADTFQISDAPKYQRLLAGNSATQASDGLSSGTRDLAPFAGTLTALYVALDAAPGVGKSWDFVVTVNGTESATTAINIADAATTGSVTGLSVTVAAGDQLGFKVKTATGTPAATRPKWGTIFVPSTAGLFALNGVSGSGLTGSTYLAQVGDALPDTTEATVQYFASPATLRLLGLYAAVGAAPGAAKSWTFTQRKGSANAALTCAISGAATTAANDTANSVALVSGDLVNLNIVAGNTPANSSGQTWAVAATTTPASAGGGSTVGGGKKSGGKGGGKGGPPAAPPSAPSGSFRPVWSTARKNWT